MKLGLSSYAYRWSIGVGSSLPSSPMDVHQFVDRAIDLNVSGVQICDNLRYQNLSPVEIREIRRKIETRGMFIETGARGSTPQYLRKMLNLSNQLGSKILRVVAEIDRKGGKEYVAKQIDTLVREIGEVLNLAEDLDIRLALENHATLSSEEILAIVRSIGSAFLKVCLDTMNSVALMEHPLQTARALAPHAVTVHLKDFKIEKQPGYYRIVGVPLGEGLVDFPQIMRILKESGLDPSVHIELYVDRKENERATRHWEEECVAKSLRYARANLL